MKHVCAIRSKDAFTCGLDRGHAGPHIADDGGGRILRTWEHADSCELDLSKTGLVFKIPLFPKTCFQCGRPFDARMFNNPYGAWSVPSMDGATGKTYCTYCHDLVNDKVDPRERRLPAESIRQLDRWLKVRRQA